MFNPTSKKAGLNKVVLVTWKQGRCDESYVANFFPIIDSTAGD